MSLQIMGQVGDFVGYRSVKDYGAVGDGVTDCKDAFSSALNEAKNQGGGDIVVPPGRYKISDTVGVTSGHNIRLILQAGSEVFGADTCDGKLLQFNSSNHVTVEGEGMLDASSMPNSGTGEANDLLYIVGDNARAEGVRFYSGDEYSVAGGDSHIFIAGDNCIIRETKHTGAYDLGVYLSADPGVAGEEKFALVENCDFFNCNAAGGAKRDLKQVSFLSNRVFEGNHGFFSGETEVSGTTGQRLITCDNQFYGLTGQPVAIRKADGSIISRNDFYNCEASMINIQGSSYCQIDLNNLYVDASVYTSPSTQRGIMLETRTIDSVDYYCTYNKVMNNIIRGVYEPIRENDSNQNYNEFKDNDCFGNTAATSTYGVTRNGSRSLIKNKYRNEIIANATTHTGSQVIQEQVVYSRTGAGAVNVYTIGMANSRGCVVTVQVVGNNSGASVLGGQKTAVFGRQNGGNVRKIGSDIGSIENSEFTTATVNLVADTAAQAIRVQIEGQSGITVDFALLITYQLMATSA